MPLGLARRGGVTSVDKIIDDGVLLAARRLSLASVQLTNRLLDGESLTADDVAALRAAVEELACRRAEVAEEPRFPVDWSRVWAMSGTVRV